MMEMERRLRFRGGERRVKDERACGIDIVLTALDRAGP